MASGPFTTSPTTGGASISWKGESIDSMPTGGHLRLVLDPSAGSLSFHLALALTKNDLISALKKTINQKEIVNFLMDVLYICLALLFNY